MVFNTPVRPEGFKPFGSDVNITLGVTGSIATYKAVALASRLVQAGTQVEVIMTEAATRMVQPLSFEAITHRPVRLDMWAAGAEVEVGHVGLGKHSDALLIAPATAHTIAKLALGLADNLLTTTALAMRGPLVIAPAMESGMWSHPATQQHLSTLRERGAWIVEPESGYLASGARGIGRLAAEPRILAALEQALGPNDLRGMKVVVTAGGTREPLDPVRYLSNTSSGTMGYAVAEAAARRRAQVTLISGPVAIPAPVGVLLVTVESAREMEAAVLSAIKGADALLMAAAVADYRPAERAAQKIKKSDREEMVISLVRNPDILLSVKEAREPGLVVVGWAAESDNLIAYAKDKLERKGAAMIVANPVPQSFGGDSVQATLVFADHHEALDPMPKRVLADRILDEVRAWSMEHGR